MQEADAIIGQEWSPAAAAAMKREIGSLREEVKSLRAQLHRRDASDMHRQEVERHVNRGDEQRFASHVLNTFRMGCDPETDA